MPRRACGAASLAYGRGIQCTLQAVLKLSLESIEVSATIPNERTPNSHYSCPILQTLYLRQALLNRGRLLGALGGRSRVRRLQARLVTSSQEARSPSGPDEGPAFSGLDNIGRRAAPMLPGSREVQASGPVKEDTVIGPKIAAVERREARVLDVSGARHLSRVPDEDRGAFRRSAPLTHVRDKEREGARPAPH